MSVADHFHQLKSGHGGASNEDVMGQYDLSAVVRLITSKMCLRGRSVDIKQRAWMAHLTKLVEQASVSRRLDMLENIIHHNQVERFLFVGFREGKVGDVTCVRRERKAHTTQCVERASFGNDRNS